MFFNHVISALIMPRCRAEMPCQGRLGEIHASAQPAAHFSFHTCTSFLTRTDHVDSALFVIYTAGKLLGDPKSILPCLLLTREGIQPAK